MEVNGGLVTYTRLTNPIFISPPECRSGPHREQHKVHFRELHRFFRQHVYNATKFGEYTSTPSEEDAIDLMVINATGTGDAEMLARAWCAEKGKMRLEGRTEALVILALSKQRVRGLWGRGY